MDEADWNRVLFLFSANLLMRRLSGLTAAGEAAVVMRSGKADMIMRCILRGRLLADGWQLLSEGRFMVMAHMILSNVIAVVVGVVVGCLLLMLLRMSLMDL